MKTESYPRKHYLIKLLSTVVLTLLLGVCIAPQAFSQGNIIIGTGTSTVSHPFYSSADEQCELLYTADELMTAGACGGAITQLGFYFNTAPGTQTYNSFTLKMKHTLLSAIPAAVFDNSGYTQVYQANYTPSAGTGWKMFTLSTPFVWDGFSNLSVMICWDNAASQTAIPVRYTTATGRLKYYYATNLWGLCGATSYYTSTSRPNISFTGYVPSGVPARPAALTAGTPTPNSLTINATPNGANDNVVIAYNTTGVFSIPTGTPPSTPGTPWPAAGTNTYFFYNGTTFPQVHSGLTDNTKYYYIAFSYTGTDWSCANRTANATTLCLPFNVTVGTPYAEGFEGISVNNELPGCWASTNLGSYTQTYTSAQATYNRFARTGTKFGSYRYGSNDYFFTQQMHLVAGMTYQASVWYVTDGLAGWGPLAIKYGATATAGDMINTVASTPAIINNTTYQELSGFFTATTTGDVYFGIHCIGTTSPYYVSIDDFSVVVLLAVPPSNVTATTISASQIDLAWTLNAQNQNVMIVANTVNTFGTPVDGTPYAVNDLVAGGGTVIYNGNGTSFSHTGLPASTPYYYRFYSINSSNEYSAPVSRSAQTLCGVYSVFPIINGFTSSITNDCWTTTIVNGTMNWASATSMSSPTLGPQEGTHFAYFNCYSASSGYQARLMSPVMDFTALDHPFLSFYVSHDNGYSGNADYILPQISFDEGASWSPLGSPILRYENVTTPYWAPVIFDLTAYAGASSVKIGFLAYSYYGNNMGLDNVRIKELGIPLCTSPVSPLNGATNTLRNLSLSWAADENSSMYEVFIGTSAGSLVSQGTVVGTTYTPAALSANTQYFWKIVPMNQYNSASGCPTWSFTTGTTILYCPSYATYTGDEDISNVTFADINNNSPTGESPAYQTTDYTSIVAHVFNGHTYPLSVTKMEWNGPTLYTGTAAVYIDWNQDGVFDPITELVLSASYGNSSNPYTMSTSVTVPSNAVAGLTRMRAIVTEGGVVGPCGTYGWGETEDYSVLVAPYDKDLQFVSLNGPVSGCNLSSNELVSMSYKNVAEVSQSNYQLAYSIDGGTTWVTETVTNPIAPNQTLTYTFTTPADLSAFGSYDVMVKCMLAGDIFPANDAQPVANKVRNFTSVVVTDPDITPLPGPYFENFETAGSSWYPVDPFDPTLSEDLWELGTPGKTFLDGSNLPSGVNVWVTKLLGNYPDDRFQWVESPCFDFSGMLNPVIRMKIKYQTEANWDGALLIAKIGNGPWNVIGDRYQPINWYTDTLFDGTACWGGTGDELGHYLEAQHQLPGTGGQSSVKLGVVFVSDEYVNFEGFAFDDVSIFESPLLYASCEDINVETDPGLLNLKIKGGIPPYHVLWTPAAGLLPNPASECGTPCLPENTLQPYALPLETTTYTAKVWDTKVGFPSDTVYTTATVYKYPAMTVDARWDATVCEFNYTYLSAIVEGGVPPYTYQWDNVATLTDGTIYNPISTANVTTTYSVTVTDFLGFTAMDNVTIETVSGYPVVRVNPNGGSVCRGDALQLTATGGLTYEWSVYPLSQSGTISATNIANPWVSPTISGVKYTCVVSSPCGTASDFAIIDVLERPVVYLANYGYGPYCPEFVGSVELTNGRPVGGTYSGPGITQGKFFTPSSLIPGQTYTITYTYADPNGTNCPNTVTQTITIHPIPPIGIPGNFDRNHCITDNPYPLIGSPPSGGNIIGTWSGTGVTNNVFYPAVAGVGEFELTYSILNTSTGCTNSITTTINVYPLPVVTPINDTTVCLNGGSFYLAPGSPVGGYYTGPGILTGGEFDPEIAGVGIHTIYYYYTDINSCTNFATSTITVLPLPSVTEQLADVTICQGGSADFSLELDGTGPWTINWTIDGVLQAIPLYTETSPLIFTVSPLVTTEYTLVDIEDATGCGQEISEYAWTVFVNSNPLPYYVVMNDQDGNYCYNTGGIAVGLSGSEPGVTYELFKDGVSTDLFFSGDLANGTAFWFFPNVTLDGVYTVHAVSDLEPTNCSAWMTGSVGIHTDTLKVEMHPEFTEVCLGGTSLIDAVIINPEVSIGPYTFNWAPLADLSPNGFAQVLAYPLQSEWFYVTVTDPTGCMAVDQKYITVNIPPTVEINDGDEPIICDGSGIVLETNVEHGSGDSIVTYIWTPTTNLNMDPPYSPAAPFASPHVATTYIVDIIDDNGCSGSASYSVLVQPSPNVVFGAVSPLNLCLNGSFTIPLQVPTVGSGDYSYSWSPATGLSSTTERTPTASGLTETTTYTVVITDNVSGCETSGEFTITINVPIVVELGSNFDICLGTAVNLFANVTSGGYAPLSFQWASNPPLAIPSTQNPSVIPTLLGTTEFFVTVTDVYGCTGTDNLAVTAGNNPVAHAGEDVTICEGECTTLIASGGTSYQWFANALPISGVNTVPFITVCPTETTIYELRVTSPCGAAVTHVTVTVNGETPLAMYLQHDPQNTYCQNEAPILLIGTPQDANGVFSGNGVTDNGNGTGMFSPSIVGTYDITYTYTNQAGCTYSISETVTVLPLPEVTFTDIGDVCLNTPVINLNTSGAGQPAGGIYSGPGVVGGIFTPATAGVGTHTLTYTYMSLITGCSNTATISIDINPLPAIFDVTIENQGDYCQYPNATGVSIYLSGSEPFASGVVYHLVLNGFTTGITMVATGYPIVFQNISATGSYQVLAVNTVTNCSQLMNGTVTINQNPLPLVYNVTGGGSYCDGTSGAAVGLDNSNYGVTYYLYHNGSNTGVSHAGVNGPFFFANYTVPVTGTHIFTVMAVDDQTGCQILMEGSTQIIALSHPFPYFVGIGNQLVQSINACPGEKIVIRQNANQTNVIYELYYNGVATGLTRTSANGISFSWESSSWAPGVYTVLATQQNPPYYCQWWMNGSATINYLTPLSILTHPQHLSFNEGGNGSFQATATGDNPTYGWEVSTNFGATWSPVVNGPVPGFPTASYSILGTVLYLNGSVPYGMNNYYYRAHVVGPCNVANSNPAVLTVNPIVEVFIESVVSCAQEALTFTTRSGPCSVNTITYPSTVAVPIVLTHAYGISAISLTITYDNTNFSFINAVASGGATGTGCPVATGYPGFINIGPDFASTASNISIFAIGNTIRISWFSSEGIYGVGGIAPFLELVFDATGAEGTVHNLAFNNLTQGACEISKFSGEILTAVYHNGTATVATLPVIVSAYATDPTICLGETLSLHVNATPAGELTYNWAGPNGFTSNLSDPVIYNATVAATGTYYVTVTDELGCTAKAQFDVTVYPEPEVFYLVFPEGHSACAGSGVEIRLSGSQVGVTYALYHNSNMTVPVSIVTGTGSEITFGPQAVTGSYSVKATTLLNSCIKWFPSGSNDYIQINPLPLWFNLQGGGHFCEGDAGKQLRLSGSQLGVAYTLLLNACCCDYDSIITTQMGTGSPMYFINPVTGLPYFTTEGYYSVVAVHVGYGQIEATGCVNNMLGCIRIVKDPLPTAVIGGGTSVCEGEQGTVTLYLTGRAPFSVVLNDGTDDFTVSGIPSSPHTVYLNPSVTTTYTIVSVTDANNCTNTGTGSATITIWHAAEVEASNSSPVCIGGPINLFATATGNGPFSFAWTGPNGFASALQNPVIPVSTLANNGEYTVMVTDVHGCISYGRTTVIVNPLPSVGIEANSPCVGGELVLYAFGQGTFEWTGPNGFTFTGNPVIINNVQLTDVGLYTVTLTDENGCENTASITPVVHALPVVTCGSNSPVCEGGTLELTASATGNGPFTYYWTGPCGMEGEWTSDDQNPVRQNVALCMAGTYTVRVYDANDCWSECTTTVVINELPTVCDVHVSDPNVYCFGCIPPEIWVDCSELGVAYELYRGGVATGNIVIGDGGLTTNFGQISMAGFYTVRAVSADGCISWMYGTVEVIEQAPPTAVISGDIICVGESAHMEIVLTGDTYWDVVINNGITKDTIHIVSSPYIYIPGTGPHILAPVVTTTYTIDLVIDRVCYNVGTAATVVVNPLPTKFTMTGGGYYCTGIGVDIGLNGSQIGVEYTLHRNGNIIQTIPGTGFALNFTPQTTGLYWVSAVYTATGCYNTMYGQVEVYSSPDLNAYTVSGGGPYCEGTGGVSIYLSGSQAGKEYNLVLDGIFTGMTLTGTGGQLMFPNILAPGVYTVFVIDPISNCTRNMNGSAVVSVKPLPTATISGGGVICYGGQVSIHVDLTGTAPWTFVISDFSNSVVHHRTVASFDSIVSPTSTRNYVVTSVIDAYCQNVGNGTAVVVVNSPNLYIVTGGGSYCEGDQGVIIGLSGSQTDVTYTLLRNGNPVGIPVIGTGNPISFGYHQTAGQYTVLAVNNADQCSRTMTGLATIVINPQPTAFNVTGGGDCCVGCTHVFVCLDNSEPGIRYELYLNDSYTGIYKIGAQNGGSFCYAYVNTGGTYRIKAINTVTGCWRWMNGSAIVVIFPTAQANLTGNNVICAGESTNLNVNFTAGTAPFSFGLTTVTTIPIYPYYFTTTTTYENITDNPYVISVSPTSNTTYSLAWVTDVYGCYGVATSPSVTVTVTLLPDVVFENEFRPYCITEPAFVLTGGMPAGGVYSGTGVSFNGVDYIFTPADAPGGSVITYTYSNSIGCQGYAYAPIQINLVPDVDFSGLALGYCIDHPMVELTGYPAGGVFSGPGIVNGHFFSPSAAGVGGPYTITYSYTDPIPYGCSNSASHLVSIISLPDVSFEGFNTTQTYCVNDPAVVLTGFPAGGVFSGPGIVNGNMFNPAVAGVSGPDGFVITYSYTSGDYCTNTSTQIVHVKPLPQVCLLEGGGICCIGCSVNAYLNCSQQGVSYQLVRNGNLFVGTPKLGTGLPLLWEIFLGGTYAVVATDLTTHCSVEMEGVIEVIIIPQPTAVMTGTTSICQGQSTTLNVTMTGTPPFEIWFRTNTDTTIIHNIMDYTWSQVVSPLTTTTYEVINITDLYCGAYAFSTVVVTVNPAPELYTVTGGGDICPGDAGVVIGLNGSQVGVHYELFLDGISMGIKAGTGSALNFDGLFNEPGMYTVISMSATTCEYQMDGYAIVTLKDVINPSLELPVTEICQGQPSFALSGGYPDGGVYFVDNIEVSYFDPQVLTVGDHEIRYEYTAPNGCTGIPAYGTITINETPNAQLNLGSLASVCFDAPEFTLTGGTPDGGTYYVNGDPATTFNPSAMGAGVYYVTYGVTNAAGCSGMSGVYTITVHALPSVTLGQFADACLNGDPIQLTEGLPGGGIYSGAHVINNVFYPVEVGTFMITYTFTNSSGCTASANGYITVNTCAVYNLGGLVTYDNASASLMNNYGGYVMVTLKLGTTTVGTTYTDVNGLYNFSNLAPGVYTVSASSNKAWGGVNSNDALSIMKHSVGITYLTGLRLKAADLDGVNGVNAIDALLAARRFVNQIPSFVVGDWAFEVKNVTIVNTDATNNFKALCYGDVNGSYLPPYVKVTPTVHLNTSGVKEVKSYQSFELPISVTNALKVGAISLVVNYPENLIDVEGVMVNKGSAANVLYTANNGELRISWYNMTEMNLSGNDVLLTLQLKSRNLSGATAAELELSVEGISEIGDRNAAVIPNVNLTYPKLAVAVEEYSISNYPNPFKDVTEIVYTLPETGKVNLKVYNLLGDVVSVLVNNIEQAANTYKINFDASNLVPGIYTYKIEVNGNTREYVKSGMMILTR